MKQWKELVLVSVGTIITIGLVTCDNHNSNSNNSSKVSAAKVIKNSNKLSSTSNSNSSSNGTVNQSKSNNTKKVVEDNSGQSTALSDFIAKHGMSPVSYKIKYNGMSEKQALDSTPDNMKTSSEIKLQKSLTN